jgi:ribonucleoside-diphosphate reductase beta chain
MSILNIKNEKYHTEANAFLDGDLSFQRYDIVKYKQFDKLTDKQLGFFWRPEEVDVSKDSKDFKDLT